MSDNREAHDSPQSENAEHQDSPLNESRESTTMRFPNVGGAEADAPETDHVLTRADQATVDALRPGTALLVVLRGPNTGARFLLDDSSVSSGRHPDSDIFLDDVTVSRKHAVFTRDGAAFSVRDVGSLNGTYLNRERIDESVLHTGDEVQIGKFRLVFYAGRPEASA